MKNIVISGATFGIGRAIAEKFAAEGFNIAICARNSAALQAMQARMKTQYPAVHTFTFKADLSQKTQVNDFAAFVLQHFSHIDILVNNVGVFIPGSLIAEAEGVFEQQMQTNLYSAYHLTRALLSAVLRSTQKPHIFNICSTASIVPYLNGGSYCISKYALLGFSKVLREELKSKQVRVTAVLPGATLTQSWEGTEAPDERFMPAEDVAQALWNTYQLSERTVVEEILMRPQLGDF